MAEKLQAQSFYQATSAGDSYPALCGTHDAAVCVIGGGFAGLGTALSLAERGETDIILLEGETIGHGASGRNGGFVFGGFSLGERALLDSAGDEAGRALYRLTLAAVEQIRSRIKRYDIDCDARDEGVIPANWFDDDRILD